MKKACFIVLAIVISCSFIRGGAITAQDTEAYRMPTIQKLNHSLKELKHAEWVINTISELASISCSL